MAPFAFAYPITFVLLVILILNITMCIAEVFLLHFYLGVHTLEPIGQILVIDISLQVCLVWYLF